MHLRRPLLVAVRAAGSLRPLQPTALVGTNQRWLGGPSMHKLFSSLSALFSGASRVESSRDGMGRRGAVTALPAAANGAAAALHEAEQQVAAALPRAQRGRKAAIGAAAGPIMATAMDTEPGAAARAAETAAVAAAAAAVAPPAAGGSPSKTPGRKKAPRRPSAPSLATQTALPSLQAKGQKIAELLGKLYPQPPIPLDHGSHFQLLCAVVLSAQTTDVAVNKCTPALFALAPDAASMAALEVGRIADCIRTLGLAPTKARNLKAMSQMLVERHGGQVPESFEELEALPGVGHKTASVVMAQAFGHDAFPVDTHIHRLAQRWGLTPAGKSVEQTEADLKAVFPPHLWNALHLQIIFFGREMCPAKGHDPSTCPICCWAAVPPFDRPGSSPSKANGKPAKARKRSAAAAAGGGSSSDAEVAAAAPKRRERPKKVAAGDA